MHFFSHSYSAPETPDLFEDTFQTSNFYPLSVTMLEDARSLLPKWDELCAVTKAENLHIICIVETWLSNEIPDKELAIDNYQILRIDRYRYGGGVIMYVHSSLCPRVLSAGRNNLELLIISILPQYSSCKGCASLFYQPPSSNSEFFIISVLVSSLEQVHSYKYLGLNLTPNLSWSDHMHSTSTRAKKPVGLLYRRFYKNTDSQRLLQLRIPCSGRTPQQVFW